MSVFDADLNYLRSYVWNGSYLRGLMFRIGWFVADYHSVQPWQKNENGNNTTPEPAFIGV